MTQTHTQHIQVALDTAIAQHIEVMGDEGGAIPTLTVSDDAGFAALISKAARDDLRLTLTTGVWDRLHNAWQAISVASPKLQGDLTDQVLAQNPDDLAHVSLVWLILHELEHDRLNHFDLIDRAEIAETDASFAIVRRASAPQSQNHSWRPGAASKINDAFTQDELILIRRCLELQADHNAMEVLFDAYSADHWDKLLHRILCAILVMMVIDLEDADTPGAHRTHPKAATRIVQLLGHVMEMPTLEERVLAQIEDRNPNPDAFPSQDGVRDFHAQVLFPAFEATISFSKSLNAQGIAADLGDAQTFLKDLHRCQTGVDAEHLTTSGAKELTTLTPINARLMPLLGWRVPV